MDSWRRLSRSGRRSDGLDGADQQDGGWRGNSAGWIGMGGCGARAPYTHTPPLQTVNP